MPSVLVLLAPVAAQLGAPVPLPGDADVRPSFGQQLELRVAAGAPGLLAVWSDERSALEPTVEIDPWEVVQSDVLAMRVAPEGSPLGTAPLRVDTGPYSQVSPDVAASGDRWLVVYEGRSVSSTGFYTTQDVHAVRLAADGTVLDADPLPIEGGDAEGYVPAVAGGASGWGVVWAEGGAILGRTVADDGTLGPVSQQSGSSWSFDPRIAFAGDRYLAVWERTSGVFGRLLSTTFAPLSGELLIAPSGTDPEVASDGTDFLVTVAELGTWAELSAVLVRADGTKGAPVPFDGGSFLALEPASVAWDGGQYVVTWNEWKYVFPDGPQESLLRSALDASGALLGAPQLVDAAGGGDLRGPVLASLGLGDTLLAWLDGRAGTTGYFDVHGRALASDGTAGPMHAISVSPPAQLAPDLAAGPPGASPEEDVNLAVFVSADSAETRVVVQRVDGVGGALDPEPTVVAGGSDRLDDPAAAWNGSVWLVTWLDRSVDGFHGGTTFAARVAPDGAVLDAPFPVLVGHSPAVGALEDGAFLVAAIEVTSGDLQTLYGRRVGGDGALLDPGKVFLGGNFAQSPTVAGFDDRWLVAWHRRPTHDTPSSTIHARLVLASGAPQPELDPTSSTADEVDPDLATAGDVATLAWSDGTDVRVREIAKDGTPLGAAAGVVVGAAPNEQGTPTVAADGSKRVVAWVDDRIHGTFEPGVGDVFAARLDAGLGVVDPGGVPVAADPEAAEGEAGLVGRGGATVLAVPAVLDAYGTWRVTTTAWRDWQPTDGGGELPGAGGPPELWAAGLLLPGETVTTRVWSAPPETPVVLVVGGATVDLPLLGGVLVPAPQIVLTLATDGAGEAALATPIAATLPAGAPLHLQAWVLDPTGPAGATATRALSALVP